MEWPWPFSEFVEFSSKANICRQIPFAERAIATRYQAPNSPCRKRGEAKGDRQKVTKNVKKGDKMVIKGDRSRKK